MTRPYGLLRAGFPYVKSLSNFYRTRVLYDIAIGKEGRLYVLCMGNSGPIASMNLDDEDLGSFGRPGDGFRLPALTAHSVRSCDVEGGIVGPSQIVADSNEDLYVSDQKCHRITTYNRFGDFLGSWGEQGSGDGQLHRPAGIAFDSNDDIYIVDTMNHRVQKFTKDGRYLMKWGSYGNGYGEFDMPWGIAIDDEGDIYVADWRNDRIQKFNSDGEFIFEFGEPGSEDGELNRPAGIAVDKDGDIYVCDWGNNRIQLFAEDGRFVQKFLGDATLSKTQLRRMKTASKKVMRMRESASIEPEKLFMKPRSVRVDDEGRMYVPDFESHRVQIYQKEAYPLTEDQIDEPYRARTLTVN